MALCTDHHSINRLFHHGIQAAKETAYTKTRAVEEADGLRNEVAQLKQELEGERKMVLQARRNMGTGALDSNGGSRTGDGADGSSPSKKLRDMLQAAERRSADAQSESTEMAARAMQLAEGESRARSEAQNEKAAREAADRARDDALRRCEGALKVSAQLKRDIAALQQQARELRTAAEAKAKKEREGSTRLNMALKKLSDSEETLACRTEASAAELRELNRRLTACETELRQRERDHAAAAAAAALKLEEVEADAQAALSVRVDLETQLKRAQGLLAQLQAHGDTLTEDLRSQLQVSLDAGHALREESSSRAREIATLQHELELAAQATHARQSELESLRDELAASERDAQHARDLLADEQSTRAGDAIEWAQAIEREKYAARQAVTHTEALARELDAATGARETHAKEWAERVREQKRKVDALQRDCGQLRNELAEMSLRAESGISKARSLEEQAAAGVQEQRRAEETAHRADAELAKCREELGRARLAVAELRRQGQDHEAKYQQLKKRHTVLGNSPAVVKPAPPPPPPSTTASIPRHVLSQGALAGRLQSAIDQSTLTRVQTEMQLLREQLDGLAHANKTGSIAQLYRMRDDLQLLQERYRELRQGVDRARREQRESESQHQGEIGRLNEQLSTLQRANTRLQTDLDAATEMMGTLRSAAAEAVQAAPATALFSSSVSPPGGCGTPGRRLQPVQIDLPALPTDVIVGQSDFSSIEAALAARAADREARAARLSELRQRLEASQASLRAEGGTELPANKELEKDIIDAENLARSAKRRIAAIREGVNRVRMAASRVGLSPRGSK